MFPVQTSLGAWLDLGTQPCYEVPCDLQVKNENVVINIEWVWLPPRQWLKVGPGATMKQFKNKKSYGMHFEELSIRWCPSATAAITFKLHVISRIAAAFQKIGKSWNAVIPDVAKFARLNNNGLTMLCIKNTKTWVAVWLVSSKLLIS